MTNRQIAFMNALLVSPNVTQAAATAGICKTSAYKYLKDPEFVAELDARRTETAKDAMQLLRGKMTSCAETLIRIVENEKVPAAVRVQAIQTVFSNVERMIEQQEIIARMDKVENQLSENKIGGLLHE